MIGDPAFVLMSPVKWSEVRIALVQSKKHTINKTICTCENKTKNKMDKWLGKKKPRTQNMFKVALKVLFLGAVPAKFEH